MDPYFYTSGGIQISEQALPDYVGHYPGGYSTRYPQAIGTLPVTYLEPINPLGELVWVNDFTRAPPILQPEFVWVDDPVPDSLHGDTGFVAPVEQLHLNYNAGYKAKGQSGKKRLPRKRIRRRTTFTLKTCKSQSDVNSYLQWLDKTYPFCGLITIDPAYTGSKIFVLQIVRRLLEGDKELWSLLKEFTLYVLPATGSPSTSQCEATYRRDGYMNMTSGLPSSLEFVRDFLWYYKEFFVAYVSLQSKFFGNAPKRVQWGPVGGYGISAHCYQKQQSRLRDASAMAKAVLDSMHGAQYEISADATTLYQMQKPRTSIIQSRRPVFNMIGAFSLEVDDAHETNYGTSGKEAADAIINLLPLLKERMFI